MIGPRFLTPDPKSAGQADLGAEPGPSPARPSLLGRGFAWIGRLAVGGPIATTAAVVLVVLPLCAILFQSALPGLFGVPPSLRLSGAGFGAMAADPYALQSGLDSLLLGLATAVLATALGALVAWLLTVSDLPARRLYAGAVWAVFLAPTFLIGQGWSLLLGPGGLAGTFAGGALLSPVGVMIVLSLKLFPFATFTVQSGLEGLGDEVIQAGRISGAKSGTVWRRLLIPLLVPALTAGGLIVFAEVLSDFGVAATLAQSANFPLTTYAIYTALESFPTNFSEAAAMSVMLVALVMLVQIGQRRAVGRRGFATRWGGHKPLAPRLLGRFRHLAGVGLGLLFVLALGVPAVATLWSSISIHVGAGFNLSNLTTAFYQAAINVPYGMSAFALSLVLAAVAASLTLMLGVLQSFSWRRSSGALGRVVDVILTTSIAVPGIVLGAGYIFLWNQPWLAAIGLGLYGTTVLLVLGYIATGLPYAVRLASGAMAQLPEGQISAARMGGASTRTVLGRIVVPQLAPTWLRIWLLVFAGAVFELPMSMLLYPPGQPTAAVAILHQFHSMQIGTGAALTVLATLGLGAVVLVLSGLLARLTRSVHLDQSLGGRL